MNRRLQDELECFSFSSIDEMQGVDALVTTRKGGFSLGSFSGMNLGFNSGDRTPIVTRNHRLLNDSLGNAITVFPSQWHGDKVLTIDDSFLKYTVQERMYALNAIDAVVTNLTNVWLFVITADCVPILLFDKKKRVIAAVHSGWKGFVNRILLKTIDKMVEEFGSSPADIHVAIGPAICKKHFEIGPDVAVSFLEDFPALATPSALHNKWHLDLSSICQSMLLRRGIDADNIEHSGFCTFCNNDLFFSHRKENGVTGRFASGITLVD